MSMSRELNSLVLEAPPTIVSVGSEGERSEPERAAETIVGGRATPPAVGAVRTSVVAGRKVSAPDPEVSERASRRRFTADYKRRILAEVDASTEPGAIGRILRREGLFSSHLVSWRKKRDQAARAALEPDKRGPKPSSNSPLQMENAKLKRENLQLQKKLHKAELIIDLQKKVSQILGVTLPALQQSDDDSEVNE